MNLVSLRLITDEVKRLVEFYEAVTGLRATRYTDEFAELATQSCVLAIGSKRTMDFFGASAARSTDNHIAIIEFRDDREYENLKKTIREFVLAPTTQPWRNRAIMFRDPDGNLINYFTPVSAEAIQKYDG